MIFKIHHKKHLSFQWRAFLHKSAKIGFPTQGSNPDFLHCRQMQLQFSRSVCLTLCDPMDCSTIGFPVHHQLQNLLKLMSTESMMPSNQLILCHPFLLRPSVFPSIGVFNESVHCIRYPKYWTLSFSINPSSQYSGLISFRIDWFDSLVRRGCK